MAESLGPDGIKYLDEAAYQSNKPAEDAKQKNFMNKVKKEVERLKEKDPASGDHPITVDGKEYTVTIKAVDAGKKYGAFFKGQMIGSPWEPK